MTEAITSKIKKMAGFRNIAVHDYQTIETEILQAIVTHHLGDIEEFYTTILNLKE